MTMLLHGYNDDHCTVIFCGFLICQVIASKYLNDEGEMEALTNSEWANIGECFGGGGVIRLM